MSDDADFYSSFSVMQDHITAQLQLDEVVERAMEILKNQHGSVIPKQTPKQLKAVLIQAVEELTNV